MEQVQIVYCREDVKEDTSGEYDKDKFESADDYWSALKFRSIREQCALAMERNAKLGDTVKPGVPGYCGANLISIGDSLFEKRGTKKATDDWSEEHGQAAERLPRTKTIKLLGDPTAEELETELDLILNWLPAAMSRDSSFHLDFTQAGDVISGDLESAITHDGWELSPGEARSEAVMQGRFWKPEPGEDPCKCWHWIPRQMWLSRSGKLWYEGMKVKKPVMYFSGVSLAEMKVRIADRSEATPTIKDVTVYPVAITAPDGETFYMAVESVRARRSFLKACDIFSRLSSTVDSSVEPARQIAA